MAFAHEIYLALAALVLFVFTLNEPTKGVPRKVALLLAAGAVISSICVFNGQAEMFSGSYRIDAFSQSFKVMIALGFFLVVAFGEGLNGIERKNEADYFMFLTLSILGLTFLVSANELLTLYIALELSSYSLYILVPLRRIEFDSQVEAGIKYVLFGAAASGITLFGMSYVFGLAHTTNIDELLKIYPQIASSTMGLVGLSMMFAGFFFKLAVFPFHLWTPDIYQGAANETSGIIATLPKIGAVAILIRLVGMGETASSFTALLSMLAIISMFFGNLSALVQTDVKRLLAFSSIAHAGYMLTGVLTNSINSHASVMYYVGGYLLMNLALFFVVYSIAPRGENITVDDLKGLHKRSPILAFTLAVGAFGLAGIPPTAGFAGKFFILTSAYEQGHKWLVILAALNTAIAIFYYLKMVKAAYSADPEEGIEVKSPVNNSITAKLLGAGFIASILALGAFPDAVINIFRNALS
jgi:NADH-quinone oxidoreductase subunit N